MYRIYTIGKMKGLEWKELFDWRLKLGEYLEPLASVSYKIIHPPVYYNYSMKDVPEREIKEFELNKLASCDIAVVNLAGINDSVGSHYELAYIDAINSIGNKHIFVVGVGSGEGVHPWILESLFKRVSTVREAAELISGKLFA